MGYSSHILPTLSRMRIISRASSQYVLGCQFSSNPSHDIRTIGYTKLGGNRRYGYNIGVSAGGGDFPVALLHVKISD